MDGFFTWLILFAIIMAYTFLVIFIDRKILSVQDPDAILHFCEKNKTVTANFVMLLPIDEVRRKRSITVEIQNGVAEYDPQELHSI